MWTITKKSEKLKAPSNILMLRVLYMSAASSGDIKIVIYLTTWKTGVHVVYVLRYVLQITLQRLRYGYTRYITTHEYVNIDNIVVIILQLYLLVDQYTSYVLYYVQYTTIYVYRISWEFLRGYHTRMCLSPSYKYV